MKIVIGKPESGRDVVAEVLGAVEGGKFPLHLKAKSLMPRHATFCGVYFKPGAEAVVTVPSKDALSRMIGDMQQVAELGDYTGAMELDVPQVQAKSPAKPVAGAKPETEKEGG